MRKTLSKKLIKGHEYFYLSWRKDGKLVSKYLGTASSTKFKKYLYSLVKEHSDYPLQKARAECFKNGLPVCYIDDNFLVYEYRNGARELMNSSFDVLEVDHAEKR